MRELDKYLGYLIIHGRLRSHHFGYLVDKVHNRLGGWQRNLLSQAARLVLIQSMTSAISTYVMNS